MRMLQNVDNRPMVPGSALASVEEAGLWKVHLDARGVSVREREKWSKMVTFPGR